MVCHIDFIVIPGKILSSGNKIPIVKPKIVKPGFCPLYFTITFAGETNVYRYTGNIVKPGRKKGWAVKRASWLLRDV